MGDRGYVLALVLGVGTAAAFAPALRLEAVVLDPSAATAVAPGSVAANVALHALNAALVLLLLARATGRLVPSALAATLFALHPLRVESIAWSASRYELLGMTAALATVLAYDAWARRGGWWRYAAAVGAYAGGVAVTPLVAPMPLWLLLLDVWPLARLDAAAPERDARLGRRVLEKLPFATLAAVAVALGASAAASSPPVLTVGAQVANAFVTAVRYVAMLLVPVGLTVLRPVTLPPWWAPGAVIVVVATTAALVAARRRAPAVAIGWLWFLIALLPVLGRPPADRFTYLPSLGLALALAGTVRASGAVPLAALVVVGSYVVTTERQLAHWRDEETVLRRALAVTDDNFLAERRLGAVLMARGAWDEAATHAGEAVRLRPDDAEARNDLGEVHLHAGHVDAAVDEFAAALAARPAFTRARRNLGHAEQQRGRLDAAVAAYAQVLEITPDAADVHASLARALRQSGALAEARAHFTRALALGAAPTEVLGPLAQTLAEAGDLDGAIARYRALLALTPDDAVAHDRLGTLAARRGDLDGAEAEYRSALRLRPDLAEAQLHLGIVLAARGALPAAVAAYDAALGLAPRLASAQYNRALALEATGDLAGARAALRAELVLQPDWPPALVRLAALRAAEGEDGRVEASRLADRAAASLGDDDPEVAAVRRLVGRSPVSADSP